MLSQQAKSHTSQSISARRLPNHLPSKVHESRQQSKQRGGVLSQPAWRKTHANEHLATSVRFCFLSNDHGKPINTHDVTYTKLLRYSPRGDKPPVSYTNQKNKSLGDTLDRWDATSFLTHGCEDFSSHILSNTPTTLPRPENQLLRTHCGEP